MIRSHAFNLLCTMIATVDRNCKVTRTNYTSRGTECLLEFQGRFYKISVEDASTERPNGEMACA